MPRHTFLDSILNRPSQSYTPPTSSDADQFASSARQARSGRWAAPSDLPNVPGSSSHASILSGSIFRKKSKANLGSSTIGSDAGASTSTLGIKSRFGRSKQQSVVSPTFYTSPQPGAYAPSSVADSQATESKRKTRWWEAGSLGIGRRSRAPSIAGDSIFSEPEPSAGQLPWTSHGLAGIGAATQPRPRARSDFGATPGKSAHLATAPPMPSGRGPGRLQSDVAPLGVSTLNPSLSKKPSKSKLPTPSLQGQPANGLRKAASSNNLPAPLGSPTSVGRMPGSLASSPHVRRLSQDSKRGTASGADWKDFVNKLSGTEISKAWEGTRDGPSMSSVAAKDRSSVNLERRKSHLERIQKELEQDAQFEQTSRDPGVVHQDLISRAASQVVGSPPAEADEEHANDYLAHLKPGILIPSTSQRNEIKAPIVPSVQVQESPQTDTGSRNDEHREEQTSSEESEEDSDDDDRAVQQHTMLEAVREEDEDGSSQGTHSRRQTLSPSSSMRHSQAGSSDAAPTPSKFKAFEAALNKSRNSTSSPNGFAVPSLSASTPSHSVRSSSISDTRKLSSEVSRPPKEKTPKLSLNVASAHIGSDTGSQLSAVTAPEEAPTSVGDNSLEEIDESSESSESEAEEFEDAAPPMPVEKSLPPVKASDSRSDHPDTESDESVSEDGDEVERLSDRSVQTGRATVTFDKMAAASSKKDVDDSKSVRSIGSTTRSSRPPTLQRRLSDVSLGTSFGMSNIMQIGRSRPSSRAPSSRKLKMSEDDDDSTGSRSDGDDDDELRAKIKAEQQRLRDMKVGDDFFGGALSAILDNFDSTNWDEGTSSAVEQLGLDVGTSATKRGSTSAQDILALNAQERINEVRRLRTAAADDSQSKHNLLSETKTIDSKIAPSFAAMWLLNQAASGDASSIRPSRSDELAPKEASPKQKENGHQRQDSIASENETLTIPQSPTASSRIRNLFGISSPSSSSHNAQTSPSVPAVPDRHQSVLNRPRHRGPKPQEMGGVSIAHGKLLPDKKEELPEDTRNTLSDIWVPQTLSQMKEEQEAKNLAALTASPTTTASERASSPPSSPKAKVAPSREKPAPLKSAIKGGGIKQSRSLADTLFTFPSSSAKESSSKADKKGKGKEKKKTVKDGETETTGRTEKPDEDQSNPRASISSAVDGSSEKASQEEFSGESGSSERCRDVLTKGKTSKKARSEDRVSQASQKKVPELDAADDTPISSPYRPGNPLLQESDSESEPQDKQDRNEPNLQVTEATSSDAPSPYYDDISPPPVSELWSGESAVSTGPATPNVSDFLDKGLSLGPRRKLSPGSVTVAPANDSLPSPLDKKLPLPPVPVFSDDVQVALVDHDVTPSAVAYAEPLYIDKTPRAEKSDPTAFGLHLIPPTPPAVEQHPQRGKMTSAPSFPDSFREEDEEEANDGLNSKSTRGASAHHAPLQRSASQRSKGTVKSQGSEPKRKGSLKRNKSTPATVSAPEYQGRDLSLPPGLVATTVATSASRRHALTQHSENAAVSMDPTAKSRRPKAKSKGKEHRANGEDHERHRKDSFSAGLASLSLPPRDQRDGSDSSNQGSEYAAAGPSRTTSPSPSPAMSVSDRSSARSSAFSSSAASDTSSSRIGAKYLNAVPQNAVHPRKIRTVAATPNGHARTSMMSAISEWESSPMDIDRSSANASPMPAYSPSASGYLSPGDQSPRAIQATGFASPIYQSNSSVTRSQSSIQSGSSPSLVRNAPVGAPTDTLLQGQNGHSTLMPGANRRLSMPLSDARWGTSSFAGDQSDTSLGAHSHLSTTSLPTVPQSSYRARDPIKASNAIDDRLYAKSTMSTIAVTSGAFRKKSIRARRSSVDIQSEAGASSSRRDSIDSTADGMLLEELHKTTMSLTSHTAPPRKLSSTQVLVQVIACSIDEMDRILLREQVRNGTAFGYVPGRSFCGRVMETGWEVKRMRMGDVIFGLQSSRKSGALAEFITIEEDLVAKAPQDCLTMEQIAALPSVGVLAHQLMINHCSQLKRGSRILILNAHDGVGLLTMQECASLGLIIVAHCPNNISDGVAICEANGAHEVIIGDALWALNTLHESSFDLVIDTVGGRRIYDAARRILAFEGQFCTCFGDSQHASANPNLRSHLRSLRRSFFKKDTKQLGYEWVGTDSSEDCRDALEAVRRAAEEGSICPRLKSVLAFAEAPRAFESTLRGVDDEPGATVVRVS